ncbi:hypothetical protein SAMN05660748_0232 [Blastococcus aggregatus]|uniref:Uncharacterized protein n=1 Tax=Blastococcus aggregatus TaxID=38502 RepID=A0A285V1Q3_9ACTN|nr:hypothetical protein [Blastococcus aggregatus]SOC46441.1 hypothetical protein SAMN05660748_0232 [Blastococcus aggregatus]
MGAPHGTDSDDVAPDAVEHRARRQPRDLAPDEERLLAALERDARGLPEIPVRDTIPEVKAPGDGPAADRGGPPDDGLTPLFAAPELDD